MRRAIARALQAAATGKLRVVSLQRRKLLVPQEAHPLAAAAGERPVHGRFHEAVVVVVAGVVDRPAGPGMRPVAPFCGPVVPDVPDRLFRVVRPALALVRIDLCLAGIHGQGQIGDARADLEIGIAGNRRLATACDGGLGLGNLLLDHPHRQIAIRLLLGQPVKDRRVSGSEGIARIAAHGRIDPPPESGERGRFPVDIVKVERDASRHRRTVGRTGGFGLRLVCHRRTRILLRRGDDGLRRLACATCRSEQARQQQGTDRHGRALLGGGAAHARPLQRFW